MEEEKFILQLGGPHLKTCACPCGTEFYGRRNQKYVDLKHKARINNDKRSSQLEKFKLWFDEIRITYRALELGLGQVGDKNWIYIGELAKHGFNPDCATKMATSKEEIEFKYILDFAFRLSEDKQYVQIVKMK